jgi:hypothetical protein
MPNEIDAAIAGLRELDRLGDEAEDLPLAYGCFGDKDDSLYLASVYNDADIDKHGDPKMLTGRRDFDEADDDGEFVPYEFDTRIMIAEGGDIDQQTQMSFIPYFAAAANNRAHLKALLDFAERAKAAVRKAAELAWDASGEGFNGEYTPKVVTPKDIDAMLDEVALQALKPEAK